MDAMTCAKCGKPASGYKCEVCGAEMASLDPAHQCGASHVLPKCSGCNLAQSQCTC